MPDWARVFEWLAVPEANRPATCIIIVIITETRDKPLPTAFELRLFKAFHEPSLSFFTMPTPEISSDIRNIHSED